MKLDIALVRGVNDDPARRALIASMVAFTSETGSELLAEGIETEDELTTLRALGVGFGQGFLLGRPVPVDEIRTEEPRTIRPDRGTRRRHAA